MGSREEERRFICVSDVPCHPLSPGRRGHETLAHLFSGDFFTVMVRCYNALCSFLCARVPAGAPAPAAVGPRGTSRRRPRVRPRQVRRRRPAAAAAAAAASPRVRNRRRGARSGRPELPPGCLRAETEQLRANPSPLARGGAEPPRRSTPSPPSRRASPRGTRGRFYDPEVFFVSPGAPPPARPPSAPPRRRRERSSLARRLRRRRRQRVRSARQTSRRTRRRTPDPRCRFASDASYPFSETVRAFLSPRHVRDVAVFVIRRRLASLFSTPRRRSRSPAALKALRPARRLRRGESRYPSVAYRPSSHRSYSSRRSRFPLHRPARALLCPVRGPVRGLGRTSKIAASAIAALAFAHWNGRDGRRVVPERLERAAAE